MATIRSNETETPTVKVRLGHRSSIPGARWATPVGWEPTNEIEGSEFLDGSWWDETEETAGLVCFTPGDDGDQIDAPTDEVRVASTGDCRVIGPVAL